MTVKEASRGDMLTWTDTDGEEPVERRGTVTEVLNRMYLILPVDGTVEKFVFRDDPSVRRYRE